MIYLGISIGIIMLVIFWASGSFATRTAKLKVNNTYINIVIGFFVYFSIASIVMFPIQLILVVPYGYLFEIFGIFTVIYTSVLLLLIKFWFSKDIFNWKTFIFLLLFACIILIDQKFETKNNIYNYGIFKNSISTLFWLNDIQSSLFGDLLSGDIAFKNIQIWYTFQLSWIFLFNFQNLFDADRNFVINNLTNNIDMIIEAGIIVSIIFSFYSSFCKNENNISSIITFLWFSLLMIAVQITLLYFGYSWWDERTYIINLVFIVSSLLYNFVTKDHREINVPLLIGIILFSYIAFMWEISYQFLFLEYCILFILQSRFKFSFTKDFYKMIIFSLIDFIFYNVIEKVYLVVVIFGAFTLFLSLVLFLMNQNYNIATNFEFTINKHQFFYWMLVPFIFIGFYFFYSIITQKNIFAIDEVKNLIFYSWITLSYENAKMAIITLISLSLMCACFAWILVRFTSSKLNEFSMFLDLISLCYLVFYNPMSIKTIRILFYDNIDISNGIVFFALIYLLIIEISSKFDHLFFKTKKIIETKYVKNIDNLKIIYIK